MCTTFKRFENLLLFILLTLFNFYRCLEENDWDYAKAALCFSKLKPNIPPAAFIH